MKNATTFLLFLTVCIAFAHAQVSGKFVNSNLSGSVTNCNADLYEPNNLVDEAVSIATVHNYFALICDEDDVDWFTIKLQDNVQSAKIMVTDCAKDYDLEVYDRHMNLIGGSYYKAGTNEVVIINYPSKGDYFLKVFGYQKAFDISATYALRYYVSNIPIPKSNNAVLRAQSPLEKYEINLFPNPAINSIKLNYSAVTDGVILISIYDHVGRLMNKISDLHGEGLNTHTLDVSYLPNGFYMVEVNINNVKQLKKLTIDRN